MLLRDGSDAPMVDAMSYAVSVSLALLHYLPSVLQLVLNVLLELLGCH
jgi:hypothetical protein